MRWNIHGRRRRPASVIENFLKFSGGLGAFLFAQVYLPAQVIWNEITGSLITAGGLKDLKSLSVGATPDFDGGSRQRYAPFNDWFSSVLPEQFIRQDLRLSDFTT